MEIAVILPCFKVKKSILSLLDSIPNQVSYIIIVDDECPEKTGQWVQSHLMQFTESKRKKINIVFHSLNQGVGGATLSGYKKAIELGADIAVKIDGDGQMNPLLIHGFIAPIEQGKADYTKGNRFFRPQYLKTMPLVRIFGNGVLSFITKAMTGYWKLMDPTNGYTAIHTSVLKQIPFDQVEKRYFFETDMLYYLSTLRAVTLDIPMVASYGDEVSSLNIKKILFTWPIKYVTRFFKRLFYNYILRDFNIATLEFLVGIILVLIGGIWGCNRWIYYSQQHIPATAGVVMLAALPLLFGIQLILSAVNYDIVTLPKEPIYPYLVLVETNEHLNMEKNS